MSAIGKAEAMTGTSRREFLKVSLAAGGGLLFAFPMGRAMAQAPAKYVLRPEAFVRIDPNGHVTLIIPQEEMGQGVYTSLAQLLADELDVGFDRVTAEAAGPSDTIYGSPMGGRAGHGRLDLDPRLLHRLAPGGRQRPRHAGAGRRGAMEGCARFAPHGKR